MAARKKPLVFGSAVTLHGEILEVFLFPLWRDAGLVTLTYGEIDKRRLAGKRSTGLRSLETTAVGRWAFSELAELGPVDGDEDEEHLSSAEFDGREFFLDLETRGMARAFA